MLQFFNPWMLAGGALAAGPIIIHLLHKRRFRVVHWAAMDFLLTSNQKNYRRVRLQEIILLLLRTLVLLLVAMAMARPFLAGAVNMIGPSQRYVVIVIDNSFSMGYSVAGETPYEQALQFAENIVDGLNRGDSVSLIAVSDQARPLVREASIDFDSVRAEIRRLPISYGSTNLPDAFRNSLELLNSTQVAQRELYIITDNQRTAWHLADGRNAELEGILRQVSNIADVMLVDIGFDSSDNTAVTEMRSNSRIIGQGIGTTFAATVTNFGEQDEDSVELSFYVDGFRQGSTTIAVPARNSTTATFGYTFHEAQAHAISVRVKPDRLTADDARHLAVDVVDSARVLVVEGSSGSDFYNSSSGYLMTALRPEDTARPFESTTIYAPEVIRPSEFHRVSSQDYEFIVLADVPVIDPNLAADLEEYVAGGGSLVLFPGSNIDIDNYNDTLFQQGRGLLPAGIERIAGDPDKREFVTWVIIRENHPLLRTFAGQRAAFLISPQHYIHAVLDAPDHEDVTVIAEYSNNRPALVEKRFGKGRVLQFGCSANDAWTDFPRRPGFLLLMQELASYAARDRQLNRNLIVADTFMQNVDSDALVSTVQIVGPHRTYSPVVLPEGNRARMRFTETEAPGIYEINIERGGNRRNDYFAVNVDPLESDLARIGAEQLRRTFPDFRFNYLRGKSSLDTPLADQMRKNDIWKQLLIAALVLMCVESVLAQRFGR